MSVKDSSQAVFFTNQSYILSLESKEHRPGRRPSRSTKTPNPRLSEDSTLSKSVHMPPYYASLQYLWAMGEHKIYIV